MHLRLTPMRQRKPVEVKENRTLSEGNAIDEIVDTLDQLEESARARVIEYVRSRFAPKPLASPAKFTVTQPTWIPLSGDIGGAMLTMDATCRRKLGATWCNCVMCCTTCNNGINLAGVLPSYQTPGDYLEMVWPSPPIR